MKQHLLKLCPALTAEQADRFDCYYHMLVEWNQTRNLTAITEPEAIAQKHFYDSLAAVSLLKNGTSCIDVGTGAGFPGVPLLIVRPDIQLTLLDSLNKRIEFLEALLQELGLNATCIHMRAEDAGKNPLYRQKFDHTVTRAVAPLPVLLELTVPLLKVNGTAIAYKGDATEELAASQNAAKLLRCELNSVPVESAYGARTLVTARKLAETPGKFPRKAGTPSKQPL